MSRTCLFSAVLLGPAGLIAQTSVFTFQPAQTMAVGRAGRGNAIALPRAEKGKPFSATVTSETVQTFLDGTHVKRSTTMVEYRDAEGRVRTETVPKGGGEIVIVIRDSVTGINYRLDPATKTAFQSQRDTVLTGAAALISRPTGRGARIDPNETVEDLGSTLVNGVQARGTRTTTIVPAGAIGNDRDFRSVDERWFSYDLNLLIKSENSDPRFGKTTYELTNITRQQPDPSLFQVPADYTITTNGRGRH